MHFVKEHWIALVILVAIGLSFAISDSDSKARNAAQHNQLVVSCQSGSKRTSINAVGWDRLHQRVATRGHAGDAVSAETYEGISTSLNMDVPAPPGLKNQHALVEVTREHTPDGRLYFELTPRARELQRQGCEYRNRDK